MLSTQAWRDQDEAFVELYNLPDENCGFSAFSMTEQCQTERINSNWRNTTLPKFIAGDISAATISATLISPIITVIDRAVVENAVYSSRPLHSLLKTYIVCSVRHPRLFFNAKPFFYVWTLYAATYTTANAVDSIGNTVAESAANKVLASSITFLSTCLVNVPLGVWKDVRFVQTYGRYTPPTTVVDATQAMGRTSTGTQKPTTQHPKFPRVVGATFLLRDAITILGSFNLPPLLSNSIPSSLLPDPATRMAVAQLFVPVLSQVVVTPIHLLGLDLYSRPRHGGRRDRARRIKQNLGPATVLRCARIIPAFGVGGIVNTRIRGWFHSKAKAKTDGLPVEYI